MNRRQFLTRSLLTTAAMSSGAIPGLSQIAHASAFAPVTARTLVNIKLDGGPDFRHLLAPAFNSNTSSFGYQSWSAMASAHALAPSASAWEQRWNQDYTPYVAGNQQFGILNNCGWLKSMWEQGKVAVVANVYGSPSRDHALASLVMDQGDRSSGPADSQRSGWGGRLAQNLGTNVMAVTRTPRAFCYAPDPADPQKRVTDGMIAAQDVRELKLFSHDPTDMPHQAQPVISRALSSYYAAKRAEIPSNSIYKRFFDMEQQLRELGAPIE
ncbi:MAG: twin-arginine translocation signal domain-containing protein, partial [Gammaproteobacteria bacterium]|nr:twin-arginine translocation signal domain-containing protein [Gammaproteobacteria bacterium]